MARMTHDNPLRVPRGPVDLASIATDATPGSRGAEGGQGGPPRPRRRAHRAPGAALRGGEARAPTGGSSWSCRGWTPPARAGAAPHRRPGRSAGGADHLVQGADRGGARPRLPVADQAGGAAARLHRVFDRSHYEDVLIARVHGMAPPGDRAALLRDQRLRARAGRRRDHRHQVHAAHLGRGAAGPLLARLDDPPSTGSTTRRHRGARTGRAANPTRSPGRTNTELRPGT